MKRILVLLDYYLPGYKAGGPTRTLANLVEMIGTDFDFWILTRDRDFGDTTHFPSVPINQWTRVGNASVLYGSPDFLAASSMKRCIEEAAPDIIYLNSFFSRLTTRFLMLRRAGSFRGVPVILAPRGEFSPAALRHKRGRKRFYLALSSLAGFYRGLTWQATSESEKEFIERMWGKEAAVHLAPNIPRQAPLASKSEGSRGKAKGELKLVFVGRISPMKNLAFALEVLQKVHDNVVFDIYGPMENEQYWGECLKLIAELGPTIEVNYRGDLAPDDVPTVLRQYHFLLLPTQGENFGHVIFEALSAGCPILISDRTPWRNLVAEGIGWDLPLEREQWADVIQSCVAMSDEDYQEMVRHTEQFARHWIRASGILERNVSLFNDTLEAHA